MIQRWKEHFEGLSQVTDESYQNKSWREITLKYDLGTMKEEVRRGVRGLRISKAPGICGIMPEMLKAGGEVVVEWGWLWYLICMERRDGSW